MATWRIEIDGEAQIPRAKAPVYIKPTTLVQAVDRTTRARREQGHNMLATQSDELAHLCNALRVGWVQTLLPTQDRTCKCHSFRRIRDWLRPVTISKGRKLSKLIAPTFADGL